MRSAWRSHSSMWAREENSSRGGWGGGCSCNMRHGRPNAQRKCVHTCSERAGRRLRNTSCAETDRRVWPGIARGRASVAQELHRGVSNREYQFHNSCSYVWKISLQTSLTFFDAKIPLSWTTETLIERSADVQPARKRNRTERTGTACGAGAGGVTVTEV